MSNHRYVVEAPSSFLKEYPEFPTNQCVFIFNSEETQTFRGSYRIPYLGGTQTLLADERKTTDAVYSKIDQQTDFKKVRDFFKKLKDDMSLVDEIKSKVQSKSGETGFEGAGKIVSQFTRRSDAFPLALDEKMLFAGVSTFTSNISLPIGNLMEINCIVQGAATIFPDMSLGRIPVCERYTPGEIYKENVPYYKTIKKIPIGKILDFPNPHSMRVMVDISRQYDDQ